MRAVNLIPLDQRRHSALRGGRSGGGVHLLLLGLAALVLLVALWTKAGWDADAARSETQQATAEATALEARTAVTPKAVASWTELRDKRLARLTTLADARFDWSHALRELARVLPADVDITALDGSVSPGGGTSGAGAGSGVRGALAVPAFELTGCAQDHDHVMAAVSALRAMDGVQRVTLESSERADGDAGAAADAGDAGDGSGTAGCRASATPRPTFSAVAFFTAPPSAAPATGSAAP